jgi:predicted metal-dependent phosphoesterase TrpH
MDTHHISRADLHMHTTYSDGLVAPEQLLDAVEVQDLDMIAITDHDTVDGAFAVRELAEAQGRRVQVIVGIEVTTVRGMHLLGLFVEKPIKMFQPVEYTIDAIMDQGGVCLAPHPLSPLTPSLGRRTIERLLDAGKPLIGVETANPTPAGRIVQRKVATCNETWKLAEFGGSDAHFLPHIGIAYTTFPGSTTVDLRRALLDHTTTGHFTTKPVGWVPPVDYAKQFHRSMVVSPARKIAQAVRDHRRTA